MFNQTKNSYLRFSHITDNSETAKSTVRTTMQILPPHLREQYVKMRTNIPMIPEESNPNPLHTARDILDLQRVKSIKPIDPEQNLLKPVVKREKIELEKKLKKEVTIIKKREIKTELSDEQILKLDRCCFSDFDLLDSFPKPKCCSNLMDPREADLLLKQRKFFMLEMERFSEELMKAMEDM